MENVWPAPPLLSPAHPPPPIYGLQQCTVGLVSPSLPLSVIDCWDVSDMLSLILPLSLSLSVLVCLSLSTLPPSPPRIHVCQAAVSCGQSGGRTLP